MTPINFVYWLQGYFELSPLIRDDRGLPAGVSENIRRHLEMCRATPGNYNSELVAFTGWIESALEFEVPHCQIKDKLNSIFKHVIDPMTMDEEVSQSQSWAHNPYDGDGARC